MSYPDYITMPDQPDASEVDEGLEMLRFYIKDEFEKVCPKQSAQYDERRHALASKGLDQWLSDQLLQQNILNMSHEDSLLRFLVEYAALELKEDENTPHPFNAKHYTSVVKRSYERIKRAEMSRGEEEKSLFEEPQTLYGKIRRQVGVNYSIEAAKWVFEHDDCYMGNERLLLVACDKTYTALRKNKKILNRLDANGEPREQPRVKELTFFSGSLQPKVYKELYSQYRKLITQHRGRFAGLFITGRKWKHSIYVFTILTLFVAFVGLLYTFISDRGIERERAMAHYEAPGIVPFIGPDAGVKTIKNQLARSAENWWFFSGNDGTDNMYIGTWQQVEEGLRVLFVNEGSEAQYLKKTYRLRFYFSHNGNTPNLLEIDFELGDQIKGKSVSARNSYSDLVTLSWSEVEEQNANFSTKNIDTDDLIKLRFPHLARDNVP